MYAERLLLLIHLQKSHPLIIQNSYFGQTSQVTLNQLDQESGRSVLLLMSKYMLKLSLTIVSMTTGVPQVYTVFIWLTVAPLIIATLN